MKPIGEAGYILSNKELFVLAGLTGLGTLIGIDLGLSVTGNIQVIKLLEQVKTGLLQKRYIYEMSQGFGVDRNMFSLVKACCCPSAVLRLIKRKNSRQLQRNYYFRNDITIELDMAGTPEDSFILTPIVSVEKALQNAQEFFRAENAIYIGDADHYGGAVSDEDADHNGQAISTWDTHQADEAAHTIEAVHTADADYAIETVHNAEAVAYSDNIFHLPLEKTRTLMDRISESNEEEIEDLLAQNGFEEPMLRDFIQALRKNDISHSILLLILGGEKNYKSYNFYSGSQFLWRITEDGNDPDSLTVSTASMGDLGGILGRLVITAGLLAL